MVKGGFVCRIQAKLHFSLVIIETSAGMNSGKHTLSTGIAFRGVAAKSSDYWLRKL